MLSYTIRRFAGILTTLLLLSLFTFLLSRAVPGGPWAIGAEIPMSAEQIARFEARYGLDKPLMVQYLVWLRNALTLDFGVAFTTPELTVTQLISRMLPYSALVGGLAALLAISLGILMGMLAAAFEDSWFDNLITGYAVIMSTIPSFVMGFLLAYFFAVKLGWFPSGGWGTGDLWPGVKYLVLPVVAYGLPATGGVARWTRQCLLEAMSSEYVRTAYAKGLRQVAVIVKHVLRNALIPMVTSFLPMFPGMMTGSLFIEQVFGIPGLGKYFVQSSTNRDYPLVLGVTMFWAVLISLTYFATDVLYGLIDPRVRVTEKR
ncbi:MAG: ABC transporter permease [Chloroflexi bacterium]|jgi:ABC-type dipeptide/oligopeptide/nickel transport system permease component|nr:ABC transporter permease [Chloroflexota bacterium]